MAPKKMWFAPKAYGFGSGLPIRWEGWAVLAGFFAAIITLRLVARAYFSDGGRMAVNWGGLALLVAIVVLICRARTEGGWRRR